MAALSEEHQVTRSQLMVLQGDLLTLSLDRTPSSGADTRADKDTDTDT